jgi:hypothetical protein
LGLLCAGALGCDFEVAFTPMLEGTEIQANVRPALAENGTVATLGTSSILVNSGGVVTRTDLAPSGLDLVDSGGFRRIQVRSAGEIVFVASRADMTCIRRTRFGAYVRSPSGSITPLAEECRAENPIFEEVAMSPNGTIATSSVSGHMSLTGAVLRGPVSGPLSILQSADNGVLFNTTQLDVNDSGRTVVQAEYRDPSLVRGALLLDRPEQARSTLDTAIEKAEIFVSTPVAINNLGTVAFSSNSDFTMPIGGAVYRHTAGVYVAIPTPIDTPKRLTQIANLDGVLCGFGNVDINDDGIVVFEAKLDGEPGCAGGTNDFDALYRYSTDVVALTLRTTDSPLGNHGDYASVRLGQINNAGQISFLTTSTEPGEPPVKVWRADVTER